MSDTPDARDGQPVLIGHGHLAQCHSPSKPEEEQDRIERDPSPPPQYPQQQQSEGASSSSGPCPDIRPPPFSQIDDSRYYSPTTYPGAADEVTFSSAASSASVPAYASLDTPERLNDTVAQTKAALPQDTKGESCKKDDEEPPPAYTEGSSPLLSFNYLMAAAGGVASILTQVQQGGPPPINTLGGEFSVAVMGLTKRLTV